MDKLPFDVGTAFERIEEAVRPWPKAALFQLAEEGYTSVFEQLLSCIVSIRTYDEVTHLPRAQGEPVLDMCRQVGVTEHR